MRWVLLYIIGKLHLSTLVVESAMRQALHSRGRNGKTTKKKVPSAKPTDGKPAAEKVAKIHGPPCSVPVINTTLTTYFAQIVMFVKMCRRFSQHMLIEFFIVITAGNSCRLIGESHFLATSVPMAILASIAMFVFP